MMQKKKSAQQSHLNKFIVLPSVLTAIAGLSLFITIAYFVSTGETLAFDTAVREFLYSVRSDVLTVIMKVFTYSGNWQTVTLICCLLLFLPKLRVSVGVPASLTAIVATIIQYSLKLAFHRARPDIALHLIQQGGYSFPSAHSFTNFIFYGMLIYLFQSKFKNKEAANAVTLLLCCLIFFIGLSRIYLGVHYPTDVLGGWALALCILTVLTTFLRYFQKKNADSGRRSFFKPPSDLMNR